jgi:hypothetical protein
VCRGLDGGRAAVKFDQMYLKKKKLEKLEGLQARELWNFGAICMGGHNASREYYSRMTEKRRQAASLRDNPFIFVHFLGNFGGHGACAGRLSFFKWNYCGDGLGRAVRRARRDGLRVPCNGSVGVLSVFSTARGRDGSLTRRPSTGQRSSTDWAGKRVDVRAASTERARPRMTYLSIFIYGGRQPS